MFGFMRVSRLGKTKDSNSGKGKRSYYLAKRYEDIGEDKKAFKHYLRAAEQGHADAQFRVGMMYLGKRSHRRLGQMEELREAYKWFLLASHANPERYHVPLKRLERRYEGSDPERRAYRNLSGKLQNGELTPATNLARL